MGRRPRLVRGKDYEIIDGQLQFSREYLLTLGGCCERDCMNCPYEYDKQERQSAGESVASNENQASSNQTDT